MKKLTILATCWLLIGSMAYGADQKISEMTSAPGGFSFTLDYIPLVRNTGGVYLNYKTLLPSFAALASPTFTGSVILPSANADPAATAGSLVHDSTVTNFTNGALRYYNGAAIKQVIDMTAATAEACTEGQIIVYDATADLWKCSSLIGTFGGFTASRAIYGDASGNLVSHATLTDTELGYLDGVTSAIQGQLDAKAPLISPSFTTPVLGAATGTSLAVTGPLTGAIAIKYVAAGAYTVGTTNGYEAYGSMIMVQNTGTITTPVWGSGKSFCTYSEGAYVVRVNPNGAEYIRLNGTLQATGVDIYSAGAAGDYICMIANTTNVWTTLGRSGTWTQGSSFSEGLGLILLIGFCLGTLRAGWRLGNNKRWY